MVMVQKSASLHPKTVSEHEKHVTKKARKKPAKRNSTQKLKVDQRVWVTAMKLAAGDPTRIVVKSATEVLVKNASKRKS